MSEYAERRDDLLADILGFGFEGWQQSLVDEFVAECEQPAWLAAWDAEWRAQWAAISDAESVALYRRNRERLEQRIAAQDALLRRAERVEAAARDALFDASGNCNCVDYAPLREALEEKVMTAADRVEKYLDERAKMLGLDATHIHWLNPGGEVREAELTVADLRELLAAARCAANLDGAARVALDGIHRVMPAGPELKQVAVALRAALEG